MKRTITILLATIFLLSISIPVFAWGQRPNGYKNGDRSRDRNRDGRSRDDDRYYVYKRGYHYTPSHRWDELSKATRMLILAHSSRRLFENLLDVGDRCREPSYPKYRYSSRYEALRYYMDDKSDIEINGDVVIINNQGGNFSETMDVSDLQALLEELMEEKGDFNDKWVFEAPATKRISVKEEQSSYTTRKILFMWGVERYHENDSTFNWFLYQLPTLVPPGPETGKYGQVVIFGPHRGQGPNYDKYVIDFNDDMITITGLDKYGKALSPERVKNQYSGESILLPLEFESPGKPVDIIYVLQYLLRV